MVGYTFLESNEFFFSAWIDLGSIHLTAVSNKTNTVSCWVWCSLWKVYWTRLEAIRLIQVSYLRFPVIGSCIVNEFFYSCCWGNCVAKQP